MQVDFACEHIHRQGSRRSTRRIRRRNYLNSCGEVSTRILHRTFRILARSNARKRNGQRDTVPGLLRNRHRDTRMVKRRLRSLDPALGDVCRYARAMSSPFQSRRDRIRDQIRRHVGPDVTLDRARSRTSAYVYGNILVLTAVAGVDSASILDWTALFVVAGTTITTFLAHILAHSIGQQLGRTSEEAQLHIRDEVRDSLPIASSGSVPALMMFLGAVAIVPPLWAQLIAALIIVGRLAFLGSWLRR